MNKPKELAEAHWEYVEKVLKQNSFFNDGLISAIGEHYKDAMIHGFKHGQEYGGGDVSSV
jgi:hypothetical protein